MHDPRHIITEPALAPDGEVDANVRLGRREPSRPITYVWPLIIALSACGGGGGGGGGVRPVTSTAGTAADGPPAPPPENPDFVDGDADTAHNALLTGEILSPFLVNEEVFRKADDNPNISIKLKEAKGSELPPGLVFNPYYGNAIQGTVQKDIPGLGPEGRKYIFRFVRVDDTGETVVKEMVFEVKPNRPPDMSDDIKQYENIDYQIGQADQIDIHFGTYFTEPDGRGLSFRVSYRSGDEREVKLTPPEGMELASDGRFHGRPTEEGTHTVTITAEDRIPGESKSFTFTITVAAAESSSGARTAPDGEAMPDIPDVADDIASADNLGTTPLPADLV